METNKNKNYQINEEDISLISLTLIYHTGMEQPIY